MPKIIGSSTTVVEIDGLRIDELAGNVATKEDTLSIAYVTVSEPTAEPWLQLDYDEWICVRKGKLELHYDEDKVLEVSEGETVMVTKGEKFRPVFPIAPTEYIPVCSPAFRPDRCHRDEGNEASEVTVKLLKLHSGQTAENDTNGTNDDSGAENDVLYHMCQEKMWEEAVQCKKAYYPPTFEVDGFFTHATAVPQRLIETANHFYTKTEGEWICLQLSRSALSNVGIITKDEQGLPVGEAKVSDEWVESKWICPHIYGGIPTLSSLNVLTKIYPMIRTENGMFVKIEGLTE